MLTLILVILFCSVVGQLFRKMGQPAVMGEIVAGLLAGPSFLGFFFPEIQSQIFPVESLVALEIVAHWGILLYLFGIGLQTDSKEFLGQGKKAISVATFGTFLPLVLGVGLGLGPLQSEAPTGYPTLMFALFLGLCLSVTAFPVLARILEERKALATEWGRVALSSAALGDVFAWCALAVITVLVKTKSLAPGGSALIQLLFEVFLFLLFARVLKTLLSWVVPRIESRALRSLLMLGMLVLMTQFAERIGIHSLFGAFVAGLILPSTPQVHDLWPERRMTFLRIFLLPAFFVLTGLRTEVGLLQTAGDWGLVAVIIAVAIVGKAGGAYIGAKVAGLSKHAGIIAALMNTRGLVELILLNAGRDLGLLNPRLFTSLVLMAIVTTLMTGPWIAFLSGTSDKQKN